MRIRKNAKISTLFYTNTNVSNDGDKCLLQKNVCQLNQSPWDIITFPSSDSPASLHQFDDYEVCYDVNFSGNGSSFDSTGAFESTVASMKISEGENCDFVKPKKDFKEILGFEDGEMNVIQEEIVLCGKRDKKGWQCGRVVKKGETVCDHHIIELQNHAVWTTKKKSGPVHGSMARTQSRQTNKRASTSQYEFYYYSGFGPSWGKKRGTESTVLNMYNEHVKVASDVNKIKATSSTNDVMDIRKEEGKSEMSKAGPTKMELACIDDVDNDNKKDKTGITGKKRGRKPIKARSLKSLL